jgi:hypothetical protein
MNPIETQNESEPDDWPRNYFNYFTEIEEHFQRARGTSLFLLSPLDWALIENWKNAGIPLPAVLKGIDDAFEKWRSRKIKRRLINSLAYCTQAANHAPERARAPVADAPFEASQLEAHFKSAAASLAQRPEPAFQEIASSLALLAADVPQHLTALEDLERRLTVFEEKMVAVVRASQSDEQLYAIRQSLDRELKPYRGKMTADQLAMLERRYLDTALLEAARLPRLSLFYLH